VIRELWEFNGCRFATFGIEILKFEACVANVWCRHSSIIAVVKSDGYMHP